MYCPGCNKDIEVDEEHFDDADYEFECIYCDAKLIYSFDEAAFLDDNGEQEDMYYPTLRLRDE